MPARPVSFEPKLSDSNRSKLDQVRKEIEREQLLLELAEIKKMQLTYSKRRDLVKSIPKFWAVAMMRNSMVSMELENKEDQELLQHLEDVWIVRNPVEPRAYSIEFTFSRNRFFNDRVLKKEYRFTESQKRRNERADSDGFKWSMLDFDWEDDVKAQPCRISWKPRQNLCQKYPPTQEDGEIMELGSFFNWFEWSGDVFDLGIIIADEIFPDAIGYFTGDISDEDDDGNGPSDSDSD